MKIRMIIGLSILLSICVGVGIWYLRSQPADLEGVYLVRKDPETQKIQTLFKVYGDLIVTMNVKTKSGIVVGKIQKIDKGIYKVAYHPQHEPYEIRAYSDRLVTALPAYDDPVYSKIAENQEIKALMKDVKISHAYNEGDQTIYVTYDSDMKELSRESRPLVK